MRPVSFLDVRRRLIGLVELHLAGKALSPQSNMSCKLYHLQYPKAIVAIIHYHYCNFSHNFSILLVNFDHDSFTSCSCFWVGNHSNLNLSKNCRTSLLLIGCLLNIQSFDRHLINHNIMNIFHFWNIAYWQFR